MSEVILESYLEPRRVDRPGCPPDHHRRNRAGAAGPVDPPGEARDPGRIPLRDRGHRRGSGVTGTLEPGLADGCRDPRRSPGPRAGDGELPRWWLILPGTWVWANLHGGWVLVPITLSLVVVGRLADHGLRDRGAWTALGMGAASVIAGTLTPAGTSSTFAIVRFSGATDAIQEWRATAPFEGIGFLTAGMAVLALVALSGSRPPISSWVTCIALLLFSWTAVRNVAPGPAPPGAPGGRTAEGCIPQRGYRPGAALVGAGGHPPCRAADGGRSGRPAWA